MSNKIKIFLLISTVCILLVPIRSALAGFGISPPYVFSDKILPGTRYEQTVTLLRSEANSALRVQVIVKAPQIADWISIDKGLDFEFPAGETRIPLVVYVDVPKNVPIGKYEGEIDINVSEINAQGISGIELTMGAQINLDIGLTRDIYRDFSIKRVEVADLELPKKPWRLPIFSRIFRRLRLSLNIENIGNSAIAPSKVTVDIYDISQENLLESITAYKLKKIPPFQTKDIAADFPIKIGVGQYWASVRTYKGNDIMSFDKIVFSISAPSTYKKSDLIPWFFVFGIFVLFWLFLAFVFKINIFQKISQTVRLMFCLLKSFVQKIKEYVLKIKLRFWQWFYEKAARNSRKKN